MAWMTSAAVAVAGSARKPVEPMHLGDERGVDGVLQAAAELVEDDLQGRRLERLELL